MPEKNKMLIFSKKDEAIHPKIASVFSALKFDLKIQHQYNISKDKYKSAKKRCSTNSISNGTAHNAPLAELKDCNDEPIIQHINYFIQKERAR